MPELLNILLLLKLEQLQFSTQQRVDTLVPQSVGWAGRLGTAWTLDVNTGHTSDLGQHSWSVQDLLALPQDVLLRLEMEHYADYWQAGHMIFTKREERIEMSISVDLASAWRLTLLTIQKWLIDQYSSMLPTKPTALIAGPELVLDWESDTSALIGNSLLRDSNVWWAIFPQEMQVVASPELELISGQREGYQFWRNKNVPQLFASPPY